MDNFDLRKYLAEGKLFEEDIASKAVSVLKSYKYALLSNREDLFIFTQEEFDDYIETIAEGDDISKKEALDFVKENEYLKELPNSPYLIILANDESVMFLEANSKKEFVETVYTEFTGEPQFKGDIDKYFQKILKSANRSEIDGDSAYAEVVIENGKIVAGPPDFLK